MIHLFLTLAAFSGVTVFAPVRSQCIDAVEIYATDGRRCGAFVNICKKGMGTNNSKANKKKKNKRRRKRRKMTIIMDTWRRRTRRRRRRMTLLMNI